MQKFRDVLEKTVVMEDGKAAYVLILGIENQTDIHYAMPVKNMVYDALNYASQVSDIARKHKSDKDTAEKSEYLSGLHKEDKLIPVITLVLYFGQTPWDGPMSVHEMLFTHDENILQYVPDYKVNLISPVSMNAAEIMKFRSDFRELAGFIQCGHDKDAIENLVEGNERFKHMDPLTASVANLVTGSELKINANQKGEFDMCAGIKEIREECIALGMAKSENAMATLYQKLFSAGRTSDAQKASEDKEYRKKLMKELQIE